LRAALGTVAALIRAAIKFFKKSKTKIFEFEIKKIIQKSHQARGVSMLGLKTNQIQTKITYYFFCSFKKAD
jgi:hypothetical protein